MGFLTKIGQWIAAFFLEKMWRALVRQMERIEKKQKQESKNEEAIEKVKTAETPEEFDDAARAVGERTDKS